jgi:hypothetical protein
MDAATIIRDFTAKGVRLAPTDHGTISITPRSRLTDADRDLLRKHKADVLAELQKVNLVNMVNIDSGHLPPARIVHDPQAKFIDPLAEARTLLTVMRRVGLRVRLTSGDQLRMGPDRGWDDVPGFEGMPDLTPSEHGVILHRLMNLAQEAPAPAVESYPSTTPAEKMQHRQDMTPSRASCGTCLHFLPDIINPAQGVGRCGVTGAGPPSGGSGYKACYPMAPRTCHSYEGNET